MATEPINVDKGPVVVSLNVEGFGGSSKSVGEVDRAYWEAMTPAERGAYVTDMAEAHALNYIGWGWHIEDAADYASTEDGAR